jgi:hypothetical protein
VRFNPRETDGSTEGRKERKEMQLEQEAAELGEKKKQECIIRQKETKGTKRCICLSFVRFVSFCRLSYLHFVCCLC